MEFPFEGIPTVPPRKNMTHMAFFCSGCRYRVTAAPSDTVQKVWGGMNMNISLSLSPACRRSRRR